MKLFSLRNLIACLALILIAMAPTAAQDSFVTTDSHAAKRDEKPFKIVTEGKQVTVQSEQSIKKLIAWAAGDRFAEANNLPEKTFQFTVPADQKTIYVMLILSEGKHYTEKIVISR